MQIVCLIRIQQSGVPNAHTNTQKQTPSAMSVAPRELRKQAQRRTRPPMPPVTALSASHNLCCAN